MNSKDEEMLRELTEKVCTNIAEYIDVQLSSSVETMQVVKEVLVHLNTKYQKMGHEMEQAGKLSRVLLDKKPENDEKIQCINDIDEELTELEDLVDQLEQYTSSLETKLEQVN